MAELCVLILEEEEVAVVGVAVEVGVDIFFTPLLLVSVAVDFAVLILVVLEELEVFTVPLPLPLPLLLSLSLLASTVVYILAVLEWIIVVTSPVPDTEAEDFEDVMVGLVLLLSFVVRDPSFEVETPVLALEDRCATDDEILVLVLLIPVKMVLSVQVVSTSEETRAVATAETVDERCVRVEECTLFV